jgi:hypothetical protein
LRAINADVVVMPISRRLALPFAADALVRSA